MHSPVCRGSTVPEHQCHFYPPDQRAPKTSSDAYSGSMYTPTLPRDQPRVVVRAARASFAVLLSWKSFSSPVTPLAPQGVVSSDTGARWARCGCPELGSRHEQQDVGCQDMLSPFPGTHCCRSLGSSCKSSTGPIGGLHRLQRDSQLWTLSR